MTKIAGSGSASGSGSISQRHGSADPDPDSDPPQKMSWIRNTAGLSTSWNSVLQSQEEYPPGAGCLHAGADLWGQDPVQALLRPRPPLLHPVNGNFSPYKLQRKSHLCILRKGIAQGLRPNFNIRVSVTDLYIPRIGPYIFRQKNRQTDYGNI